MTSDGEPRYYTRNHPAPEDYLRPEDVVRASAREAGHPYASVSEVITLRDRVARLEELVDEMRAERRQAEEYAAEKRERS